MCLPNNMVSFESVKNISYNSSFVMFGPFGISYYDDIVDGDSVDTTTFPIKLIISIVMGISMFISVLGNVCTCTVIARNRSMRTPTNCYLANLAITDLLISFFIPIDLYIIWMPDFYPFGELGCRFHFILMDWFCNCNLFIITAFTIERYLVITKPFLRQKMMRNSRVFKIVAVLWIVSLAFCLPDILYIDLLERKKYVFCYYTVEHMPGILIGIQVLIFFVLPMVIVLVLYVLIIVELKKQDHSKLEHSLRNTKQNRDKAVRMVAAVASLFLFFWLPYWLLRVMMIYPHFKYEDNYSVWKIMNYISYDGYLSTAVNPILYSLMSRKFRQAFKDILNGRRSPRGNERKRSVATSLQDRTCLSYA